MAGKEKCRMLRDIRRQIAECNDIELITKECTYQGTCRGTCPKCEQEVRYLEEQLAMRRSAGMRIALAGVSIGAMLALSGCSAIDRAIDALPNRAAGTPEPIVVLDGEVAAEDIILANTNAPEAESDA